MQTNFHLCQTQQHKKQHRLVLQWWGEASTGSPEGKQNKTTQLYVKQGLMDKLKLRGRQIYRITGS